MHLVHKASIELNTGVTREPGAWRHWVQHSLLEELDAVLTDAFPNDEWVDVDRLELNLHLDIAEERDETLMRSQLREQVRQWASTLEGSAAVKPTRERMVEIFTQYLLSGTIPTPRQALKLEQWLREQAETGSRLPEAYAAKWLRLMQQTPAFERGWQMLNNVGAWMWVMVSALPETAYRQATFPQAWLELGKWLSATEKKRLWLQLLQHTGEPAEQQIVVVASVFEESVETVLPQLSGPLAQVLRDAIQQSRRTQNQDLPAEETDDITVAKNESVAEASNETISKPSAQAITAIPANGIEAENAGLVLLAPYLPAFFQNIYGEGGRENEIPGPNGPALLHYLATGQTEAQEWQLVLPKLLCGMPFTEPCSTSCEQDERIVAETTELLQSVINHWGKLGSTSPDGLRANFLQRTGMLTLMADHYELKIAEQAADILLNYLPWNYKLIRLPWMQQMLFVHWA